jgi:hypothetical protein
LIFFFIDTIKRNNVSNKDLNILLSKETFNNLPSTLNLELAASKRVYSGEETSKE